MNDCLVQNANLNLPIVLICFKTRCDWSVALETESRLDLH